MPGSEQTLPPAAPTAEPTEPVWHTVYTALVLDARRAGVARLLVVPAVTPAREGGVAEAWGLPRWSVEEKRDDDGAAHLTAEARERLGLDVVLLRHQEPHEDETRHVLSATLVLELRAAAQLPLGPPDGRRWITPAALESLTPQDPAQWALVEGVLKELASGVVPTGRPPWAMPGWFTEASAWMVERLGARGCAPTGRVEQFRNWCISSVLRVPTPSGYVYLKAPSAHFGAEARITTALAERFPASLPRVLATDIHKSWLLLEDVGDAIRRRGVPVDATLWERALCQMGQMQRACVGQVAWLLEIGCADRRLARLRAQIPALLEAPETRAETDVAVLERLAARVPELQASCDALAACGIPETLIHGDLHAGNVGYKDGRLTVFDWTDAAVGHPFIDLLTFLPNQPRAGIEDPAAVSRRLLEGYLEGWTTFAPMDELRRAVGLLQTVARLHHAQSYLQILRSVERPDYWQFQGGIASWLEPVDGTT